MIARPLPGSASQPFDITRLAALAAVDHPDILVGVASSADNATARHMVATAAEDLAGFFPTHTALIVSFDGSLPAGEAQLGSREGPIRRLSLPWPGDTFAAVKVILQAAHVLQARACVLSTASPPAAGNWIARLATPVIRQGYDLAVPHYVRHKYADLFTDNLMYPLMQALYGLDIRQPLASAWALSAGLAEQIAQCANSNDQQGLNAETWLMATALAKNAHMVQVGLGTQMGEGRDVATWTAQEFAGPPATLFALAQRDEGSWLATGSVQPVPLRGPANLFAPPVVKVNVAALRARLLLGATQYGHIWRQVLAPDNLAQVQAIIARRRDIPDFAAWLWVRIVYDFLAASRQGALSHPALAEALLPLHLGRVATLVMDTASMANEEAEEMVLLQAETFAQLRPYLAERWQGTGNGPGATGERAALWPAGQPDGALQPGGG